MQAKPKEEPRERSATVRVDGPAELIEAGLYPLRGSLADVVANVVLDPAAFEHTFCVMRLADTTQECGSFEGLRRPRERTDFTVFLRPPADYCHWPKVDLSSVQISGWSNDGVAVLETDTSSMGVKVGDRVGTVCSKLRAVDSRSGCVEFENELRICPQRD